MVMNSITVKESNEVILLRTAIDYEQVFKNNVENLSRISV